MASGSMAVTANTGRRIWERRRLALKRNLTAYP